MVRAKFGAALLTLAIASGAAMTARAQWQGPYVGANLGYEWGSAANTGTRPSGIAGGLLGGYNWQAGQFVFGGEADIQKSAADDVFAPWKFSNPWFGTLRGRAGLAMQNILLYGTIGLAYGTLRAQNTLTGLSESHFHTGWAAGAGLQVALTGNWSARAEYLYADLSERTYAITGSSNGLAMSYLRMGVSYRF
jgi:outer membrane immunogenic protein